MMNNDSYYYRKGIQKKISRALRARFGLTKQKDPTKKIESYGKQLAPDKSVNQTDDCTRNKNAKTDKKNRIASNGRKTASYPSPNLTYS